MPRALITGASAGIGAAYAELLSKQGYELVLVARRRERLDALAARLGKARVVAADLTKELGAAEDAARGVDLLVNNAGFGGYRKFVELDPKVADDLLSVHVRAVVQVSRAALPGMVVRKQGGIISVASLLAFSGTVTESFLPARAVYAGTTRSETVT